MTLLRVDNLTKRFPASTDMLGRATSWVHAVNGVSLSINAGETLGVVGESGCGKSTLAKLIVRLIEPDHGSVHYNDRDIMKVQGKRLRILRREIQMVFQDPVASLNPRMMILDILAEPFLVHKVGTSRDRRDRVAALLDRVGLPTDSMYRYPHEFSGGQRQRIGIARAIALQPKLIIADEPVSALDVSVQGEILNLLMDLQAHMGLAYIFIAHDMKVIAQVSHRIAVMYLGRIVETFPAAQLLSACHPYTRALLSSVPDPDPDHVGSIRPIEGDVPSPIRLPTGCPFHPRCAVKQLPTCRLELPPLEEKQRGHCAACHFPVIGPP